MRISWTALTLALALPVALIAADALKSGLPVGDQVPAFNVRDITGPNKGKTLCYRCKYGDRPVVAVFTRKVDDTVNELVKKIDAQVGKNEAKKMAAFVVVLTDEPDVLEPKLEAVAKDAKVEHTPLTIIEGQTGPPDYKLAKDAEVTVMMWVDSTVKVNHAFEKGKLDKGAIETIVKDTKKILE
jgi:transcriptional regulator of nitric oxide reductase